MTICPQLGTPLNIKAFNGVQIHFLHSKLIGIYLRRTRLSFTHKGMLNEAY